MSEPQHLAALRKANEKRFAIKVLRRQVGEGRIGVMSAIINPVCHNLFLADVLVWQPQWAAFRADNLLADLGFNPAVQCGALTVRQRQLLARMLRANGAVRDLVAWEEQQQWRATA